MLQVPSHYLVATQQQEGVVNLTLERMVCGYMDQSAEVTVRLVPPNCCIAKLSQSDLVIARQPHAVPFLIFSFVAATSGPFAPGHPEVKFLLLGLSFERKGLRS